MAKYKYIEDGGCVVGVKNNETGALMPDGYTGYLRDEYEEWLTEGNTPDPAFTEAECEDNKWANIRTTRNRRLVETDDFCRSDIWEDLSSADKAALKQYRRDLRRVPQVYYKADDVIWPVAPDVSVGF